MVLGINNRTENWKTAYEFAPLFRSGEVRLQLVNRLIEPDEPEVGEARIELFWNGVRDYLHSDGGRKSTDDEDFAERYLRLFPNLRSSVEEFARFSDLRDINYDVSTEARKKAFADNLYHTEIDIVLESPSCLFIGEAKHETAFRGTGNRVLVHQLIRQYVMAKILIERIGQRKQIVPFVVGNSASGN